MNVSTPNQELMPSRAEVPGNRLPGNIFSWLFSPQNSLLVFSLALLAIYVVSPLLVYASAPEKPEYLKLAWLTLGTLAAMWLGSRISVFDAFFSGKTQRMTLNPDRFNLVVWSVFAAVVVITFATAPSIPFLSALQGAGAEALNQERGEFLKGRQGAWKALLYLNTMLANTIVPYSIVLSYVVRNRWRHVLAFLFFVYCISFLQKALFLNLVLPLLVFLAIKGKLKGKFALFGIATSVVLLVVAMYFSMEHADSSKPRPVTEYMSSGYAPSNAIDYFTWRAVAVPTFTAADTLIVHARRFDSEPLLGTTSSLIAMISGKKQVNLERMVFRHQFGRWNKTANANAVFVVDAYVNFGWVGIAVFGLFVGLVFRWFSLTNDAAFASLWTIFAFILFSASLIGLLLSNGFAYMLAHALMFKSSTPVVGALPHPSH